MNQPAGAVAAPTVGTTAVGPKLSAPSPTLSTNGQKARYGVSYIRNICAQAGFGMTETSADEDVLAVDCSIDFAEGPVRIQVKCTSNFKLGGRSATWPVDEQWVHKWQASKVPVYFVLVIVPGDLGEWLDHRPQGTLHRTAAFWNRIEPGALVDKITVAKNQRLNASTLTQWHQDLLAVFTPAGTP